MDELFYIIALLAAGFAWVYWRYSRVRTRRFIDIVGEQDKDDEK